MDVNLQVIITGAMVALVAIAVGLLLRKKKLHDDAVREVARDLMSAATELRDAIQDARAPVIDSSEYPAGWPGPDTAPADENAEALEYVYGNRYEPVTNAISDFEDIAQRFESLQGRNARVAADKLVLCANTLRAAIDWLVTNEASGGQHFKRDRALGKKARDIVSAAPDDEPNKLNEEIREAETALRSALEKFLP